VQVLGGAGFIEESGAAQFYRDARITPIYEGTNGIQAIDLVMRKLPMGDGAVINGYLAEIEALDEPLADAGDQLADIRGHLSRATETLRTATEYLNSSNDVLARMAGATPYQEMLGTLAGGYYLARQALDALPTAAEDDWMAAKVATASFYAVNLLPKVHGLLPAAINGSELLFAIDDSHIGT
jgi:acyl-CoA dehydrogenase